MYKKGISALGAVVLATSSAQATEGINLIGIGPVQQGTAGAGVASAQDSTWLILNPAGLTDIERTVDASFQVFAPNRTIDSSFSGGAGRQRDTSTFYIPSVSASFGTDRADSSFGVGLYGTSGMGVKYDFGRVGADTNADFFPDTPQNQVDQFSELQIAKLTATYARQFDNGLSLGAGPLFVIARLRTDMLNANFVPQSGNWDESYGLGAIFGANQKITDRLSIGASYITEQFLTEFDEYDELFEGSLNLPQQLTVGAAFELTPEVELLLDYRWVGWGQLETFGDQFGWEDQHIVKAGVRWAATERLALRAGVSHGNSPIDSDAVFANGLFPAIVETHLAGGLSYAFDTVAVDLSYVHAFENTLTESGPVGNGTEISMNQNSLTLGARWKF